MPVSLNVTPENLLEAVVSLPEGEFDRLIDKARKLRKNSSKQKDITGEQPDLLHKINTIFPAGKRARYGELYARFKNDSLTEAERAELSLIVDEFEKLNARRLKMIGDLAKLRSQSVDEVIERFELTFPADA